MKIEDWLELTVRRLEFEQWSLTDRIGREFAWNLGHS